jgi:hypothetical protein
MSRPAISGDFSVFEYSSKVWLLETSQVGRIRTFLGKTTSTAHCEAESSSRCSASATVTPTLQFPIIASAVHEKILLDLTKILRNDWVCVYALRCAVLELGVFFTRACHLSQLSSEFRHEPTGEVEEQGQEKKMKFHC